MLARNAALVRYAKNSELFTTKHEHTHPFRQEGERREDSGRCRRLPETTLVLAIISSVGKITLEM